MKLSNYAAQSCRRRRVLALWALIFALPATASESIPCNSELKLCLDRSQSWFKPCAQQAITLAETGSSTAQEQRLIALCERARQAFDSICRKQEAACTAHRVDALKRLAQ